MALALEAKELAMLAPPGVLLAEDAWDCKRAAIDCPALWVFCILETCLFIELLEVLRTVAAARTLATTLVAMLRKGMDASYLFIKVLAIFPSSISICLADASIKISNFSKVFATIKALPLFSSTAWINAALVAPSTMEREVRIWLYPVCISPSPPCNWLRKVCTLA